jgi:hypothetical protein
MVLRNSHVTLIPLIPSASLLLGQNVKKDVIKGRKHALGGEKTRQEGQGGITENRKTLP